MNESESPRKRDTGRPIRVAVVSASDSTMRTLLWPQIQAMMKAGYQVHGVSSPGSDLEYLRSQGLSAIPITIPRTISPLGDLKALWRLVRLFRKHRFDIVHTHSTKGIFLGQIAAWLARVPIRVITFHGLYFTYYPPGSLKRWIFRMLETFPCRLATFALSQSQEDVDMLVRERKISDEKARWLGNGMDMDRFDPNKYSDRDRKEVRKELDIPEDAFVIGVVARMIEHKGFDDLFGGFAAFRREAPNAYLLHMGFIDRVRKTKISPELAKDYGIMEYCRFAGQREDLPRLMAAMDIFCLASHWEGYPRSVMEANAMYLPAIVADTRGSREAVADGVNGLIVPMKDPEALAAAMVRLWKDEDFRKQCSQAARRRAEELFDERRVFSVILETYRELLEKATNLPPAPPAKTD